MSLDELEKLAREALKDGDWFPSDFGHGVLNRADAAFMSAAKPAEILRLVAIARAARDHADAVDAEDSSRCLSSWTALRKALEAGRASIKGEGGDV